MSVMGPGQRHAYLEMRFRHYTLTKYYSGKTVADARRRCYDFIRAQEERGVSGFRSTVFDSTYYGFKPIRFYMNGYKQND